jgi:hypothetical protein
MSLTMATVSPAQTCREVVRDSSGRMMQTIERQKSIGGVERTVTCDASGRVTGTSTSQTSPGGYASGRPRRCGRFEWREGCSRPEWLPRGQGSVGRNLFFQAIEAVGLVQCVGEHAEALSDVGHFDSFSEQGLGPGEEFGSELVSL